MRRETVRMRLSCAIRGAFSGEILLGVQEVRLMKMQDG